MTTALILLPIAGALLVWLLPWRTARGRGGLALLVALAELVLWVVAVQRFDFGSGDAPAAGRT